MLRKVLILTIIAVIVNSCKTIDPCPEEPIPGNLGSIFNSDYDEYSPFIFEDALYFTTTRMQTKEPEAVFKSVLLDGEFQPSEKDETLPLKEFKNSGLPVFYRNENNNIEMYFAGVSPKSKTADRDIFFAELVEGQWTTPIQIENINTSAYESHPAISPDGKFLVFCSDRQGGKGNIDLWLSLRMDDGAWSEPVNLQNVNTEDNELSPFIAEDNSLYYSSRGFSGFGAYDIIKAEWDGKINWNNPRALPFPINTEFNESGPAIFGEKIYYDSDRRGGCGGKDLYAEQLCGPVELDVEVNSESGNIAIDGKLILLNENDEIIEEYPVKTNKISGISLQANKTYKLQYFNSCYPYYVPEQIFKAPCSDTSSVKLVQQFVITDFMRRFDFEQYKIPFFVSGYYRLNTPENLEALRLQFNYNLLGNTDSTKYIENPGAIYQDYAFQVQSALKEATEYILNIIRNLNPECEILSNTGLKIAITGYADPRGLSAQARYSEDDIFEPEFDLEINRGVQMTNMLLSKLRAYYTAQYLSEELLKNPEFRNFTGSTIWEIYGKGVDDNPELENIYKRRVNIEIGVITE